VMPRMTQKSRDTLVKGLAYLSCHAMHWITVAAHSLIGLSYRAMLCMGQGHVQFSVYICGSRGYISRQTPCHARWEMRPRGVAIAASGGNKPDVLYNCGGILF
jgi:hypothetical protein